MRLRQSQRLNSEARPSNIPSQWLFYLIAGIGILISLLLWYAFVLQSNANLHHIVRLQAQHVAKDIDIQFELRISALKHMAKHLSAHPETSFATGQNESTDLLNEYSGIEAIASVDPALQIRWISPKTSKIAATKQYSDLIKQQSHLFQQFAQKKQIGLSSSFTLTPNDKGIIIVIPTTTGFLISIINLSAALAIELNNADYIVHVLADNQPIFQYGQQHTQSPIPPSETRLDLYGSIWKIYVEPSARLISAVQTNLPFVALVLGIFIAILFAITIRLAHLARERAKSLDEINHALTREITERLQAEETKQKLERALLQGQKLQAIGTLAGGIAHDFNNILYAIIGFAEMAQEDVIKDSLLYKNLGKILEGSRRGQELVSQILAFSRRQVYAFKPISLTETIESILSLIKPAVPASIMIDFTVAITGKCLILGNQTQLHQVIMNIINNAVDAMDGDGTININVSHASTEDYFLKQLPQTTSTEYCKIDISDEGSGMDQQTLERIFDPFFTTKEVGKGTGLGLATAHAIMKEHQGDILVTSELGQGSTFTLYLPLYLGK